MTIKLPASVVQFAAGETALFDNFADYWNQWRTENSSTGKKFSYIAEKDGKMLTLEDKERALNAMLIREVGKRANFDLTSVPLEQAVSNPNVAWAAGNIVSQMIDAVLPDTMVQGTSAFSEIKTVGWGESAIFDIKSRDLFPVTKTGRGVGMRQAEMHKGFEKQLVLNPIGHMITVGVSLFRVLSGQESLADFTVKALRSIETEMTKDIYTAFAAAFTGLSTDATTGLKVTGFSVSDFTKLAQKVSAFSGGAKPVVLGTKVALSQVLPDDPNYRYDLTSPFVTMGYVRTLAGVDTLEIPQVADWASPFGVVISDASLWIVAPGTDKIVKCVLGGSTISHIDGQFDSALLLQDATFTKNWIAGVRTSAIGGLITL